MNKAEKIVLQFLEQRHLELLKENEKLREENENLELHCKNTYDTSQEIQAEMQEKINFLNNQLISTKKRISWFCRDGLSILVHGGIIPKSFCILVIQDYFIRGKDFDLDSLKSYKYLDMESD